MIELREITQDNFDEVLALQVEDGQKGFVSTVAQSLAQAWLYRDTAFPFAVYVDQTPVGFVMLGYYAARNQYTLWKFLIDRRYQNRGYGRQALSLAVRYLEERHQAKEIYTGVSVGNETAKHLYLSFGFRETGLVEYNMEELKYTTQRHKSSSVSHV